MASTAPLAATEQRIGRRYESAERTGEIRKDHRRRTLEVDATYADQVRQRAQPYRIAIFNDATSAGTRLDTALVFAAHPNYQKGGTDRKRLTAIMRLPATRVAQIGDRAVPIPDLPAVPRAPME